MCNIAGYVGNKRAAPILMEMLKRQEGYDAGFYSGIATLHEGKIYYAKLTGDAQDLEKKTNALSLPGTIGVIHGRTQSGGGDKWAHPFVTQRNGENIFAYVANGSAGRFKERDDVPTAEKLIADGYEMLSRDRGAFVRYQVFSDGSAVHMSDVMCQLIACCFDEGRGVVDAIEKAFCDMPSEIVGLLLSLAEPNAIAYSRINMPMFVSFCAHGAYLASTPSAFLADAKTQPQALPTRSSGLVYADRLEIKPYAQPTMSVAPITAECRALAYERVCEMLKRGEYTFPEIRNQAVLPLFTEDCCAPAAQLCYEILYWLDQQGKLRKRTGRVDGVFQGLTAPKEYFSLQ